MGPPHWQPDTVSPVQRGQELPPCPENPFCSYRPPRDAESPWTCAVHEPFYGGGSLLALVSSLDVILLNCFKTNLFLQGQWGVGG